MRTCRSQAVAPRPAVEPRTAAPRAAEPRLRAGIIPAAIGAVVLLAATARAADTWTDISTTLIDGLKSKGVKLGWPGGCSGAVVNRLTGDVVIKVVGGGLWRSADKGATWQPQGAAVKVRLGPFFGADENTMMVVGDDGAHLTKDAGKTWTHVAGLKPAQGGYGFATNWFGWYS